MLIEEIIAHLDRFWENIKANVSRNIFSHLNRNKYKVHGSRYRELAENINNCTNIYFYNTKNRISEPLIFVVIVPTIHEWKNLIVEIKLDMNGEIDLSFHKEEHPINIKNKKDKNNIHINKIDMTLFNFNDNISKIEWVIQHCEEWIYNILLKSNFKQQISINNTYHLTQHESCLNDHQSDSLALDNESQSCDDIYWGDEEAEEIDKAIDKLQSETSKAYDGESKELDHQLLKNGKNVANTDYGNEEIEMILDSDSEQDIFAVPPSPYALSSHRRHNNNNHNNNHNHQIYHLLEDFYNWDNNNNTLSLSQKIQDSYKRINNNFDGVYANDNNNNDNMVANGEIIDGNDIYDPNPNIEEDENEKPNGIDEVENYKKLELVKLYDNILNMGKGFDGLYAKDEDNVLNTQEKKSNSIHKCDKSGIDENGNLQVNEANESSVYCSDEDSADSEYKYDEQKEGHQEIVDDKTYIFPREYKNIGPVFSYGKPWSNDIQPKYQHLKEEVLNNKYAPITEKTWNGILKKCNKILKGEFSSKRKNRWSKLLRDNKIGMKNLVALKLYTDFDLLQREFRKSFRAPYNKTKERLQAFYHWREALQETFRKFSNIPSALNQPSTLFHGINSIMCLDQYQGTYYGPCSTTTDLHVARSFAGKNGMILVMKPETNTYLTPYKVLDISWISDYPDEREYLLLDHKIEIETWILSSDYDQYYHYYHNTLTQKKVMKGPSGHLSYQNQKKIPKHLTKLKALIQEIEIKPNNSKNNSKVKIKQNLDFNNPDLLQQEKIDLLIWMFQFALGYKYGKQKPSKYDQSLNANIQHVMKQIHIMQVPPKLVNQFMEQLAIKYQKEMSVYFIRSVLNEYFINTYCPLDAAVETTV